MTIMSSSISVYEMILHLFSLHTGTSVCYVPVPPYLVQTLAVLDSMKNNSFHSVLVLASIVLYVLLVHEAFLTTLPISSRT